LLRPEIHRGTRFRAQQDCAPTNVIWGWLWVYLARKRNEIRNNLLAAQSRSYTRNPLAGARSHQGTCGSDYAFSSLAIAARIAFDRSTAFTGFSTTDESRASATLRERSSGFM
jgi:hypothetical protein